MNFKYIFPIIIAILYSSCAGSPPHGHRRASGFFPQKILLQSSKGLYIRLEGLQEPILIADAPTPAQADTFYFCDLGDNIGSLLSMNEKYIATKLSQNNQLTAHQTYIGDWEKFIYQRQDDFIILQSKANNLYVLPDPSNKQILTASLTSTNDLCRFKFIPLS